MIKNVSFDSTEMFQSIVAFKKLDYLNLFTNI